MTMAGLPFEWMIDLPLDCFNRLALRFSVVHSRQRIEDAYTAQIAAQGDSKLLERWTSTWRKAAEAGETDTMRQRRAAKGQQRFLNDFGDGSKFGKTGKKSARRGDPLQRK